MRKFFRGLLFAVLLLLYILTYGVVGFLSSVGEKVKKRADSLMMKNK